MELSPFLVISGAIALAIGQYTFLSTYAGQRYVQRYKNLRDAFSDWQDKEATKFRSGLRYKARLEKPPEDIVDFVRDWVKKSSAIKSLDTDYENLGGITKAVLVLSALSVLTGAFAFSQSTQLIEQNDPLKYSLVLFVLAVLATFYYAWKLGELTSVIAGFETGTQVDEIVKLLMSKQREQ